MDDDWEREYEAERQRVLRGEAVSVSRPARTDDAEDEYAAFYAEPSAPIPPPPGAGGAAAGATSASSYGTGGAAPGGDFSSCSGAQHAGPEAAAAAAAAAPVKRWAHEEAEDGGVNLTAYPTMAFFERTIDTRFNLPIVGMPPAAEAAYATKIGRMLFIAAPCKVYFKTFFGHAKQDGFIFATARAVYFGSPKGQMWLAKDIHGLRSLHLLGPTAAALRSKQGPDVVFRVDPALQADLAKVLPRLFQATRETLQVVQVGEDREKPFRNGCVFLKPEEWPFELVEDPRTGISLNQLPPEFAGPFQPLLPKMLHWFGPVTQITKNRRHHKRVFWITPTCLYVNDVGGVAPDGRGIRRCVGMEHLHTIFQCKDAPMEVGVKIGGGPAQPDLHLIFDSPGTVQLVLFMVQRCYYFRVGQPVLQKTVPSVQGALELADEDKLRPEIFVMRTKEELLGLLRR